MIDQAHQREKGTASRNFRKNRQHFIDGDDYFRLTHKEIRTLDEFRRVKKLPSELVVLTLTGYTMLTKSLTDNLAWKVQRELVNSYFNLHQTAPQQAELTLDDILNAGHSLEKTLVEVTHTKNGEIINVDQLTQRSTPEPIVDNQQSTTPNKPLWIDLVETFFAEIDDGNIPEKMRQNMLIAKETITLPTGKRETHPCLFFRASNLMALLRENSRFFDLLKASSIRTTQDLLAQLNQAGVLALNGKTKEKGIPINPSDPAKTRRVPHLVAMDLVVLKQEHGIVLLKSEQIAQALH